MLIKANVLSCDMNGTTSAYLDRC